MRQMKKFLQTVGLMVAVGFTSPAFSADETEEQKPTLEELAAEASKLEDGGGYAGAAAVLETAMNDYPDVPSGLIRHAGELRFFAGAESPL